MIEKRIELSEEPEGLYGKLKVIGGKETVVVTDRGDWRKVYANVANVLLNKATPAVSLASVRRVMAVFDAAFESVRLNSSVKVQIPALE